jgi:hypothetical protein
MVRKSVTDQDVQEFARIEFLTKRIPNCYNERTLAVPMVSDMKFVVDLARRLISKLDEKCLLYDK